MAKLDITRLTPQLVEQPHPFATHPRDFFDQVNRQPDRFPLIGQSALDALLDPPRAVRRKFAALLRIELLDGLLGEGLLGMTASFVLTTVWMVGMMNAVNLIDGMDGLAAVAPYADLNFKRIRGPFALTPRSDGGPLIELDEFADRAR